MSRDSRCSQEDRKRTLCVACLLTCPTDRAAPVNSASTTNPTPLSVRSVSCTKARSKMAGRLSGPGPPDRDCREPVSSAEDRGISLTAGDRLQLRRRGWCLRRRGEMGHEHECWKLITDGCPLPARGSWVTSIPAKGATQRRTAGVCVCLRHRKSVEIKNATVKQSGIVVRYVLQDDKYSLLRTAECCSKRRPHPESTQMAANTAVLADLA